MICHDPDPDPSHANACLGGDPVLQEPRGWLRPARREQTAQAQVVHVVVRVLQAQEVVEAPRQAQTAVRNNT